LKRIGNLLWKLEISLGLIMLMLMK